MFFAAYAGSSMHPTLREPEMMEIVPYGDRPVRVGDVAFFRPPETRQSLVHRVVRVTPAGIATLGDNNAREDAFLLSPQNIQGRVVAAWRGQRRRTIAGGLRGRMTGRGLRWGLGLCRGASPVLNPLYQALSRRGWIARLLPPSLRPRVVVFQVHGHDHYRLLLGRRVIGRYEELPQQWRIQRPFHLLVEGKALPSRQRRNRMNRIALEELRQAMEWRFARGSRYELMLADGGRWVVAAGNEAADTIVSQLGSAMQLRQTTGPAAPSGSGNACRLLVRVEAQKLVGDCYVPLASGNGGTVVCSLRPCAQWGGPFVNLVRLALVPAREAQTRGGLLIHGALAEKDGRGVILAAPGGTGKSTASQRFPAPWRSLCDDTTLVVRDSQGRYWAHPWPTWSRFQNGGPGGSWDVQRAVPLAALFVLAQAEECRAERVGSGQAVSLLVEGVKQASQFMPLGLFKEEVRALHLEGFNNLCALVRAIPAYVLHLNRTGAFWREIERALEARTP